MARRLRAVNIAAWLAVPLPGTFAVIRLLDASPEMPRLGLANAAFALTCAAIPLLHRFGELVAPLAFTAVSCAFIFWVSLTVGTAGGAYLYYLTAPALMILFFGIERMPLALALSGIAAALIIAVHVLAPPNTGLLPQGALFYGNFLTNLAGTMAILFAVVLYAVRQAARAEAAAEREYSRSESLLENILPPRVAERLKQTAHGVIADRCPEASILFADLAGFTARASDMAPEELVQFLNGVFTKLDALVEHHRLEKIKTTGDAYMVVSGVTEPRPDHAWAIAELALEMRDLFAEVVDPRGRAMAARIGIASGPVVAGIVGANKFFYDVWGDTVNLASRMESTGEPGKIQVTAATYELLKHRFELQERGVVEVKGKGPMRTWFLLARKH